MAQYLISIKTAIVLFPILAILFTIPYKIYHSHRKSPITLQKSIVLYSFMFYLLCTYCLIILPLPSISEVAGYTWITALTENCFLQVIFNIFLFIPLGIYLKHYFRLTLPQILLLSFTLSLFLEFTQLTGLYGIYPRGYRLFDLDDLILNTTGRILGSKSVPFEKGSAAKILLKIKVEARSKAGEELCLSEVHKARMICFLAGKPSGNRHHGTAPVP